MLARRLNHKFVMLFTLLLVGGLAACGPSDLPPTGREEQAATPTAQPPTWTEPAQPVTLDNAAQIQPLGRLDAPGTPSTVFDYAFSPDGTRLAGLNNELLLAWNLVTGELIFSTGRKQATKIFYSPDKTEIYTLNTSGVVEVYDAERGTLRNDFRASNTYDTVAAFDDNAGILALGSRLGEIKVWDALDRTAIVALQSSDRRTSALAFSPDGTLLAVASEDGFVRVWDWREKKEIAAFDHQGAVVHRLAFSPDQALLATGTGGYIALWSLADQELRYALESGIQDPTDVLIFSPDGRYLVSGGAAPELTIWEAASGARIAGLPEVGGNRTSATFSPDGKLLLTSVMDGPVSLWNLSRLEEQQLNRADLSVGSGRILYNDWTADGFLLAFVDATGPIYLWGSPPGETG